MSTEIIIQNDQPTISVYPEIVEVSVMGTQVISVNVMGGSGPAGTPGQAGAAATVTVGTVTTGSPGSQATVTNVGTSTNAILNFSIPQGQDANASIINILNTDYDFDITGNRDGNNRVFHLRYAYVNGSTRVYVNGLRQTIGTNYDYREIGSGNIQFNYNIENGDLITVDYIKL